MNNLLVLTMLLTFSSLICAQYKEPIFIAKDSFWSLVESF